MRTLDALRVEWRIALRFLGENPLQSLLIVSGIAVGAAVIVFITALITGLQDNLIAQTLGSQSHIKLTVPDQANLIAPAPAGTVQLVNETLRAQRLRPILDWQQVLAALDAQDDLLAASPLISGPAIASRGVTRNAVVLMGMVPERYLRIVQVDADIVAGSFRVGAGNAVIGSELAHDLGLVVGDKLQVSAAEGRSATLQVAGIFTLGVPELDERFVYLDLQEAQTLLALPGGVTVIDATIARLFDAETIATRLRALTQLKTESWMESNADLLNALRSQSLSTQMITLFVAISVAFGIASVLAISVVQRTREIGILRAMGSRRRQILRVFLLQGGMLGFLGSLAGAAAGYGLVQVFNVFGPRLFFVPVDPWLMVAAVTLATVTGVLAAAAPARRAARYDPAEAIRYV